MKKRLSTFLIIVCLILSACGRHGQTSEQYTAPEQTVSDEKKWTLEAVNLPNPDNELEGVLPSGESRDTLYVGLAGETVFRYVRQYDEEKVTAYYIQTSNAPYTEWETKSISPKEGQRVPSHMNHLTTLTAEGEWNCLYEEEGSFYLERISLEGEYSLNRIAAEGMEQVLEKADKWYVQEDKNYIYSADGLYCYQEDFTASQKLSVPKVMFIEQMSANLSGETLYLAGISEDGASLGLWRYNQDVPVIEVENNFAGQGYIVFYSDTEGYLCDLEHIWQFDMTAGSMVQTDAYSNWGYHLEKIFAAAMGENEALLVLAQTDKKQDTQEYLLLKRSQQEEKDKKTLELATSIANTFLKESIVQFNNQSEEYEIILRERPPVTSPGDAALQDWENYVTRIQTEITSGGGPDLIDTQILSVENGAAKGYLRDLTEDFSEQRELCEESIWQNCMVDGQIYSIPYIFSMETFVTPDYVVNDRNSWTLEELMQITRESDVEVFGEYISGFDLFWNLGIRMEGSSQLIDWENKVCHLNGPEAVELLEFTAEYGDTRNLYDDMAAAAAVGEVVQGGDSILRGEALTAKAYFADTSELQYWETYFRLCDSVPTYIGFPSENGEAGHIMEVYDLMVNQSCKYPEAAVEFLEFLLSEERQNYIAEYMEELYNGFPVRQTSLERALEKTINGEYKYGEKTEIMGEEVEIVPASQENVQKFLRVVETAKPRSKNTEALFSIIDEELAPYYAGDKSAKEVLDVLQNRVQLLLDEQ